MAHLCSAISMRTNGDTVIAVDRLISIKEITEQFRLTPYTVNYYTNIGLLRIVTKKKNRRLYDYDETAERMNRILQYSKEGYPLLLIKKLINDASGALKREVAA